MIFDAKNEKDDK